MSVTDTSTVKGRLLAAWEDSKTLRLRLLAVLLWCLFLLIIVADYARAQWGFYAWLPSHWAAVQANWMSTSGQALAPQFVVATIGTSLVMLIGSIAVLRAKPEKVLEAVAAAWSEDFRPRLVASFAPSKPRASAAPAPSTAEKFTRRKAADAEPVVETAKSGGAAHPPKGEAAPAPPSAAAATAVATPAPTKTSAAPTTVARPSPAATVAPPLPAATDEDDRAADAAVYGLLDAEDDDAAPAPAAPPAALEGIYAAMAASRAPAPQQTASLARLYRQSADLARLDLVALELAADRCGYTVIPDVRVAPDLVADLVAVSGNRILVIRYDGEPGVWQADEKLEHPDGNILAHPCTWGYEGNPAEHPSPVMAAFLLAAALDNHIGSVLAAADDPELVAVVILAAATLENVEDVEDVWAAAGVQVYRIDDAGPVVSLPDWRGLLEPVQPADPDVVAAIRALA